MSAYLPAPIMIMKMSTDDARIVAAGERRVISFYI